MAVPIDRPEDLRPLNAKYAGRCQSCRTPISIGEACFFSSSLTNIELETLRKTMTAQTGTVGEPIDVAMITPTDGFVWVRHKSIG